MSFETKNTSINNSSNSGLDYSQLPAMYKLFMQAPVIICIVKGEENIISFANDGMLEIWGRGPEVIGKKVEEVFPEFVEQGLIQLLNQVRTTAIPFNAQESPTSYLRNGISETRYFNFTYQPFFENEGDRIASGVFGVAHDVTAQVVARKKVEESEEKFRNLFTSINQGYCVLEMLFNDSGKAVDYRFLEVNSLFEEQTGLKDVEGKKIKDIVPNIESHWMDLYGKVAITGESIHFYQGSEALGRYYEVHAYRTGNPSQRKVAVLFTDITEKRKADIALEQVKERFDLVSKATQDSIWDWNLITNEIWWNEGFKTMFGYSDEDIESSINSWYLRIHPDDKERVVNEVHEVIDNGGKHWEGEYRFLRKDGTYADVFDRGYALHDKEGKPYRMLGSMQDITERKRYEISLEQSKARWQLLANSMPAIVWTAGPDGSLDFLNTRWYQLTGFTEEESIGFGWAKALHPEDADRCMEVWNNARDKGIFYEVEMRYQTKDQDYVWMIARGVPIKNKEGNIEAWFGTSSDIHQQKMLSENLEALVTERTAELSRSNESLEEFAYAASHDLKEPIRKILFFSERLKDELTGILNDTQASLFTRMEKATLRMERLIDDLLSYSQITKGTLPSFELVDLNETLNNVLEDLELEILNKAAIIHLEKLPRLQGNDRQLQQMFQNLISNALKYSRPEVTPEIFISSKLLSESENKELTSEEGKAYYLIEVKDNGIGFEQQYAERIFNVFTRLHGNTDSRGTGIGLSIVRKVVQNHHGFIRAESEPGIGSVFSIYLPLDEQKV